MSLIQISTSIEYGAYYYDLSTGKVYHVPYEDLLELNNVRSTSIVGGLIGGIVVGIGMVGYAQNLRYGDNRLTLLLLLIVGLLSSCLFYWLPKSNQKRISRLIRDRYRALNEDLNLSRILKHGRKVYIQMSVYCIFLFSFAIISLFISIASASVLYALFSIGFFDVCVMMIAILQPLGKILAYSGMKRKYNHK